MLPLFDLMMKAQNGDAMEAMSRQFGLAQDQMSKAMEAVMPAFSTGFKRTTSNPYDLSALMSAITSGSYAKYFEDMTKAFSPQGIADGNSILGQIFGSKDVSRAIAAQAEQMSGIGQDIYKRMLPIMANAMVGGLFKQMADQFQATGEAISSGKTPNFMEQWMQATGMAGKPQPQAATLFDNPFTQSFQAMFATKEQPEPASTANPFAGNPFVQAFETMMKSAAGASPAKASDAAPPADAYTSFFNQMFDSGIEVQKNYQKSMDDIFETYLSNMGGAKGK